MHTRARHFAPRALMALVLLLMSAVPAGAHDLDGDIVLSTDSSPTNVSAGYVVAYPVTATNSSRRTINHIRVSGEVSPSSNPERRFTFLFATSEGSCTEAVCTFSQLAADASLSVTFYYVVPTEVDSDDFDTYTFTVTANVAEGPNDNSQASHQDTFHRHIDTRVRPEDPDFVAGHAVFEGPPEHQRATFSTGLDVDAQNKHGTAVTVPSQAKVTIEERAPIEADLAECEGYVGVRCFGWGSYLDVGTDAGDGEVFPTGFLVTMVWDDSQLPKGMNPKKLRVIHVFDEGVLVHGLPYEIVDETCDSIDSPTNMPCFVEPPHKVGDRDIKAVMKWDRNGVGRGW